MATRPPTNHRRQQRQRQRQRQPSISSDDSSASNRSNENGQTHTRRRPLTTPRPKRRSIGRLNDLVRRQKEEQQLEQQRRQTTVDLTVTPQDSEHKLDSETKADNPRERRLIQVAVRCRPRKSRRVKNRGYVDESDNDNPSDYDSDASDDGDSRDRLPHNSVVVYDSPDASAGSRSRLPALSVPSHVLALSDHGPRRRFEFDCVFPPWKQQRDVYDAVAYEAIEGVLLAAQCTAKEPIDGDGDSPTAAAHATVVAYGQTGTGKTYTMGMLQHTDPGTDERAHGIIPRAVVHILARIQAFNRSIESQQSHTRLVASMSFLQIYLETIQDLLVSPHRTNDINGDRRAGVPGQSAGGLPVRLDPATNDFYVAGLSEFPIADVADARALLELAAHNRVLAATARNKTSSRSHTLLTISIKRQFVRQRTTSDLEVDAESDEDDDLQVSSSASTVSFVDLAGSERVEGALHFLHATRKRQELRIREAKFINRSLSALGSVIAALSAQDDRRHRSSPRYPHVRKSATPHIRFRDSQLTKLLQSRLMNGHGRLVLIATIDDRPVNLTETLSTLKFASQCRCVDLGQTRTATDAARKQRDETVRKQVVAEVAALYEVREATLRREYEARIEALGEQIHSLQHKKKGRVLPQSTAAYVALCSLADMAQRRQQRREMVEHPPLESFSEEDELVKYVAELYRQLREAIQFEEEKASDITQSSENKRGTQTKHRRVLRNGSDSTDSTPPQRVGDSIHGSEVTQPPPEEVRSVAATSAHDSEFQTLARYLFASGMLQNMVVSSDEDEREPYSQL